MRPGASDCYPTVKPSSRTPAAGTSYEVTFVTPQALAPSTDSIVMVLDEDIGVPSAIAPNSVQIRYSHDDGNCNGTNRGNGTAGDISLTGHTDPRRPTTISITPAIIRDNAPDDIPAGATVTINFTTAAGISNPTEGGAYSWTVATKRSGEEATGSVLAYHPDTEVLAAFDHVERIVEHQEADDDHAGGLLVDWEIQLSYEEVGRGEEVTIIGRGYKNGSTLTFWRDANFDGVRDTDEAQLCQTSVDGNDIGYCTFTVQKPPFVGTFGECVTVAVPEMPPENSDNTDAAENVDRREAAENADCNFVNGVDGLNHTSIWIGESEKMEGDAEFYRLDDLPQVLELTVEVVAKVGADRRLNVQLRDFPEGELVEMYIGGVPIDLDGVSEKTLHKSGSLHLTVDLPGTARRGYQSLRVVVRPKDISEGVDCSEEPGCHEGSTVVWVEPGALLRAFPEEVLPNQRINLEGKGFIVENRSGEIAFVTIGGHLVDPSRINDGEDDSLATDRNGNWAGYVDLPINSATTAPGKREIQVTDIHGRKGSVEVTIPPREVVVTPIWGRPGSIVTLTGTGFPARNDSRSGVHLRVYYESGAGITITSAAPDTDGNFTQEVLIPLKTPAPSSNVVRVEFDDDNGTTVVTTTSHEVPGATVAVSPAAGTPGTPVSLTGQGFRKFTKVNSAMVGELDVTPGGNVTTDANGEFSLTFVAPGVGVGRQTVRVTVAGVTASAPFDISLSGVSAATPVPVAEALESLGEALVRVFHFNNDTKVWTFYDPELVGDENTQEFVIPGETYLILVRETVTEILNGKQRNLTCFQGTCWNQIIW